MERRLGGAQFIREVTAARGLLLRTSTYSIVDHESSLFVRILDFEVDESLADDRIVSNV